MGLTCVDFFGDRFAKRLRDTVAAACSRWIFRQVMHPSDGSRAGFAAKETDVWADPAVKNRGYDSQRGSCHRKISTHVGTCGCVREPGSRTLPFSVGFVFFAA